MPIILIFTEVKGDGSNSGYFLKSFLLQHLSCCQSTLWVEGHHLWDTTLLCKQLSVQKEVNLISFGKARHFSNVSVSYPFFPPGVSFSSKGQLISKCPFGIIVWTNIPTKLFLDFCPEYFCSFLGASWKLFGLLLDLVFNI